MKNKIAMLALLALCLTLAGAAKDKTTTQSVEIKAPASKVWAVLVDRLNCKAML